MTARHTALFACLLVSSVTAANANAAAAVTLVDANVSPDGHVISTKLAKSSGDAATDKRAIEAVSAHTFAAWSDQSNAQPKEVLVPVSVAPDVDTKTGTKP